MSKHRAHEAAARQMADIRRLQLQRAQAEESAARRAAQRHRAAHEHALDQETEYRAGYLRALHGGTSVDVAILRQWMQANTEAEQKTRRLQEDRETADAALQIASTEVRTSEQRLADAEALLREAKRVVKRKADEKQLDAIELLMRLRTS